MPVPATGIVEGASAEADAAASDAGGDLATETPPELPPELIANEEHPVRIFFEEDKAEIQEIAHAVLDAVAERLRLRSDEILRLVAHADNRERIGGAMDLARERAEEVRRYLEEHGVDTERFIIDARGDFQPLGEADTDDGRAMNRRVDFVFERRR